MSEQKVTSLHEVVRRRMAKDLALTIRRAPTLHDATRIADKVLQQVQDSTCLALIEEFDLCQEPHSVTLGACNLWGALIPSGCKLA